jgi:glucose-6-phosphate isomerase
MGTLLSLYEAKIVFQGFMWRINSFDQEGVQLGKILATDLLEMMQGADQTVPSELYQLLRELEK